MEASGPVVTRFEPENSGPLPTTEYQGGPAWALAAAGEAAEEDILLFTDSTDTVGAALPPWPSGPAPCPQPAIATINMTPAHSQRIQDPSFGDCAIFP
ncbi:hypothetical protein GCM10023107_88370 [Actinoplanes octamycinicus]|nr:hypothetical protein Aoc01nite_78600 [Actinoplanes octamycinicus]